MQVWTAAGGVAVKKNTRWGGCGVYCPVCWVVVLFGHNKIPGMMKNVAEGLNIFKKELKKTSSKKPEEKKNKKQSPVKKSVQLKKSTKKK